MVTVKCKRVLPMRGDPPPFPVYKTEGSAGADLCSDIDVWLVPGLIYKIPTGLKLEIPEGYEGQIRPRSGLALKGVTVVNAPGTLDSDYRGEVCVLLVLLADVFNVRPGGNKATTDFHIQRGDRIAQLVIAPVQQALFVSADELTETERGAGGFGSTGK